ncbi:hypothetical protein C8F04DRAFT_1258368 [Mycena alexandri]|uniref:Uncharacterized protein n=1 Tax=Mycena alexandri TaxID=1745969 RepID=A0AAD6T1A7_9AGAR|nr:hypothetical protein C8F04DRAFT_1258368 [Mycena alexandri]
MEIDPDIPNDDRDGGPKRRRKESSRMKVRVVGGPEREIYDQARDMEAYHKDQVTAARQKNNQLAADNQQILAQLQAAEKVQAEHAARIESLQEELLSKSGLIAEMQQHEGRLEAQFMVDQGKLQELKLLAQRNDDVERLNRLLKKDEALQLRAYNYLQGKKNTPQTKPPARRGTRASLDPVHNSSTRTIEIPLDPVPVPRAPKGKTNPKPKSKLAPTPALANLLGTDLDTLRSLIGKFEKLIDDDDDATVTVEGTTPKKRNGKKFKKLPHVTYTKFAVDQANGFCVYNPAEEHKIAACEEDFVDPPDVLFQWDFSRGYAKSRWNKLMIEKIVNAALESDGDDSPIAMADVDPEYLEQLMKDKLKRYHGGWKALQPRFNEQLGRMETTREAKACGTQAYEQHQLATQTNSSKHCKYEDRIQTIIATIDIKKDDRISADIATWERLLEMLELLGEQGMLSEEEDEIEVDDTKIIIFKVKLCVWREPRIVDYLRVVDAQTALYKKHKRGPITHSRVRTGDPGSSKVPRGLPMSLYNSTWLKKATPAYVKNLKISKEAFKLFVAAVDRMAVQTLRDMESSGSSLLPPTFPHGAKHFDGHIETTMGVFGVHFGDPRFLLNIPRPEDATAPDGYSFRKGDFRRPLWINPHLPYLLVLPRDNPFHGPLFLCLNVDKHNVPIEKLNVIAPGEFDSNIRWGLKKDLVNHWVHLEGLLRVTLRVMIDLYGGRIAEGCTGFYPPSRIATPSGMPAPAPPP